jgi:hypothetical protein
MIVFPSALRYRPSGAGVRAPLASINTSLFPTISALTFFPEGVKTSKARTAAPVRRIAAAIVIEQFCLSWSTPFAGNGPCDPWFWPR